MIVGDNPVQVVAPIISRKTGAAGIRRIRMDASVWRSRIDLCDSRSLLIQGVQRRTCASVDARKAPATRTSARATITRLRDYACRRVARADAPKERSNKQWRGRWFVAPSTLREKEGSYIA